MATTPSPWLATTPPTPLPTLSPPRLATTQASSAWQSWAKKFRLKLLFFLKTILHPVVFSATEILHQTNGICLGSGIILQTKATISLSSIVFFWSQLREHFHRENQVSERNNFVLNTIYGAQVHQGDEMRVLRLSVYIQNIPHRKHVSWSKRYPV